MRLHTIALASAVAIAASLLSGATASAAEAYWSAPADVDPTQESSRVVDMDSRGDSAAALLSVDGGLAIRRSPSATEPSGWSRVDLLTIADLGTNVDNARPAVAVSGNDIAVAWCDPSTPGNVAFKVWSTAIAQRVTVIDRGVACASFVGIDAATINGRFTFTVAWASGEAPLEYVLARTYWQGALQPVDEIWFQDVATDNTRVTTGRPIQVQVGDTGAAVVSFVTISLDLAIATQRIATRGAAQADQLAQWSSASNLEPRSDLADRQWDVALGAPSCSCYSVAWGTRTTLEYRRRTLAFHAELASSSTPALASPQQIHVTTTSPGDVVAWVERVREIYFVNSLAQQFAPAASHTVTVRTDTARLVEIDLSGNASGAMALAVAITQPDQEGALLRLIQSTFTSAEALWADPAGADVETLDGDGRIRNPGAFVPTTVTATSRPRVIWTSEATDFTKVLSSYETGPRVPGKPTNVTATAGDAQATVAWRAPADPGTSAITRYTVTATPGGQTCQTAGALTCTVLGLTNGTRYVFDVTAANASGAGLASAPSSVVVPGAAEAPSEPRDVAAVAGDGEATVTWQAPASAGSSAITGYRLVSTPGDIECTTAPDTRECRFRGLTNGTEYFFTVRAVNDAGDGLPALSNAVTPSATPAARPEPPTNFTAKAQRRGKVVLTWVASPSPNVTGYIVGIKKGSGAWRPRNVGDVTTKTYTKVKAGTRACYRVAALDDTGVKSRWTTKVCVTARR
ncbi:MAG: fibronectin type III domain-containing protein [Candidatus Nanopelagicales bacterium]